MTREIQKKNRIQKIEGKSQQHSQINYEIVIPKKQKGERWKMKQSEGKTFKNEILIYYKSPKLLYKYIYI